MEFTANGIRFYAEHRGNGETLLLCLHGFPESSFSYRNQLEHFASLGLQVLAPDLRGYGKSDKPRGVDAYRIETLVADVLAMIAFAKSELGAKRVVLVGHDWGGAIAWEVATRHPREIAALVILNMPHIAVFLRTLFTDFRQLRNSGYMFLFQLPVLPEMFLRRNNYRAIAAAFRGTAVRKEYFSRDVLETFQTSARSPGALTAMINYYRASVRGPWLPERLRDARNSASVRRKVEVPTLMIWGEQDAFLRTSMAEACREWVHDFSLVKVPDASHWVQQDAPETVNRALTEWLSARHFYAAQS